MQCIHCGEILLAEFAFCSACGQAIKSTEIAPGSLLGRYQITRIIGKGGFGVVYEANDPIEKRRVAIKLLNNKTQHNLEATSRFLREAQIALKIKHPNIIEAYELGALEPDRLWLAMELLDGETLYDYLKRKGPPPVLELLALLGPICRGLDEAHRRGIVHRDFNSKNIMMARTPRGMVPKILDFGLASLQSSASLTDPFAIRGTPRYMAPEQWRSLKQVGTAADIYALGVVVYYALSGQYPFEAETPMSWMKKHSIDPPLDLDIAMSDRPLPRAVRALVMQTLAKDPAARPQKAVQFFEALCRGFQEAEQRDTFNTETVEFPSTDELLSPTPPSDTLIDERPKDTLIDEKPTR